jgi:hypothetical protein
MPSEGRNQPDSQQVEIFGRSALTAQLVADGLEVATPERDIGIDLLAYTLDPWGVVPVQMKCSRNAVFSVHRKYSRFPGLLMVYVWNVGSEDVEFYAMAWDEAHAIADRLGWTRTRSWEEGPQGGGYGTTRPSARVREELAVHRMRPGAWPNLVRRLRSDPGRNLG